MTLSTTGPNNQNTYVSPTNQTVVDTANTILLNLSTITVQNIQSQSLTTAYLNAGSNTSVAGVASAGTLLSNVLTLPKSLQPPLPVSGGSLYIDPADNVMKAINSFGTLTTYSPETSKGDIAVHTGTTLARLPVGLVGSTFDSRSHSDSGYQVGSASVGSIPGSFGSEYNYIDSLGNSTTTSRTFQTKATLTTTLLLGGNYLFQVSYACSNTQTNKFFEVSVMLDGTTTVHDNSREHRRTELLHSGKRFLSPSSHYRCPHIRAAVPQRRSQLGEHQVGAHAALTHFMSEPSYAPMEIYLLPSHIN